MQASFANENFYHVFNRGVAKGDLFVSVDDQQHLVDTFSFYLDVQTLDKLSRISDVRLKEILAKSPERPLVRVHAYCLMKNHFHLLLEQLVENGITNFMKRSLNSYTRYFNTKYDRVGTLFQGTFKAKKIDTDEQLLHVSRYIHLNPYNARLVNKLTDYPWSSYHGYKSGTFSRLSSHDKIIAMSGSRDAYLDFLNDYADYSRSLSDIKDLIIES